MRFFLGFLLGVGVGVAVGLLMAPQSGEEMRAQLAEQGITLNPGTLNESLRERATQALSQGRDLYTRTKNELSTRYSNARSGNL